MIVCSPPYPDKFHSGDIAVAKRNILFNDGTQHRKGQKIIVDEKTVSFYNVHHLYYDKVN